MCDLSLVAVSLTNGSRSVSAPDLLNRSLVSLYLARSDMTGQYALGSTVSFLLAA